MGFEWKGKMVNTFGDTMDAMAELENETEGAEFMAIYRSKNHYADENVGYMTGYMDNDVAQRIKKYCKVSHPIFDQGRSFGN